LKLLISKINHQDLKLKEHQDKEVKEVVVVEIEVVEVLKEAVVVEIEVVEVLKKPVVVEIEVVEVLKAEEAVLDQELLLMLMMMEMKFLKKFTEKDNPMLKILMLLIMVMKKDQELVEAAELKRKMVMEKVTGETDQRDNIKRRLMMGRQR